MAAGLSDRQIEKAAGFVSETRSPLPRHSVAGDAASGAKIYASCAACHGADAGGNEALGAPALDTQNDWYMIRQLENYRAGIRGYDPEDLYGQQMRASVALLEDDAAIRDVVKFITTLQTN
jgi:cytochrome c oxidase subunit 2